MFDSVYDVLVVLILAIVCVGLGFVSGYWLATKRLNGDRQEELLRLQHERDTLRQSLHDAEISLRESLARESARASELDKQVRDFKQELDAMHVAEKARIEQENAKETERQAREHQRKLALQEEQAKVLTALEPVKEHLQDLRKRVTSIEENRQREMGQLGMQLKALGEQQQQLDAHTTTLVSVLKDNRVRGSWGEVQLRNIVESAGLLARVDFDEQVSLQTLDGENIRPDMVIHLPNNKFIPVDAKVPFTEYQAACALQDARDVHDVELRETHLKNHAHAVRDHVRKLSNKEYWKAFDLSPEFVIAFIPNDTILQAALQYDPTLIDDAFAHRVALTTPVTLWSVLKTVAYSWQQEGLSHEAQQLFTLTKTLYERFSAVGNHAAALGKNLSRAVASYNKFASSLESRLLVTARKINTMDGAKVIGSVDQIDPEAANVYQLSSPELLGDVVVEE